jgi:hypothetical protein
MGSGGNPAAGRGACAEEEGGEAPDNRGVLGASGRCVGAGCSVGFGDAEDFLNGGEARWRPCACRPAEGDHAAFEAEAAELGDVGVAGDDVAELVVDDEQLVDADAAGVAGLAALVAALGWSTSRRRRMPWSASRNSAMSSLGFSIALQWTQRRRMRRWASTALTAAPTRKGSRPMLTRRVIELGASLVWSVERTRWPVSAAWTAMCAVSMSRISPSMTTSGSWRSRARSAAAKVMPIFSCICVCVMPSRWYSTGSSTVCRCSSSVLVELAEGGVERRGLTRAGGAGDEDDAVRGLDLLLPDLSSSGVEAELIQFDADGLLCRGYA